MNEKELWERFKSESKPTNISECPDINDLAAYAEGRLEGREREKMEAHLSRCDPCLDMLLALKAVRESEAETRLLDVTRAMKIWDQAYGVRKKTDHPALIGIAASLLFLLISFGGFKAGTQWVVSSESTLQSFLDEDMAPLSELLGDSQPLDFMEEGA